MAVYRTIHLSFWTDSKVDDNFTPEDKYFYLYLLTNPHTNICGCYEIGDKQFSRETGYNAETISRLIQRFQSVHDIIRYDAKTKEILILNWHKYNWTSSDKLMKNVEEVAKNIKSDAFRDYVFSLIEENPDTVSIPYPYTMDTSVTVTVSDTVSDTVSAKQQAPQRNKGVYEEFADGNSELLDALKEFDSFRKLKKRPLTDNAKKRLINKLKTFHQEDWIQILFQSIDYGWTDIYELKKGVQSGKSLYGDGAKNTSNRFSDLPDL